ncbi:MAG: hypothetical protein AB1716_00315 [Planctomycetota bacterium]
MTNDTPAPGEPGAAAPGGFDPAQLKSALKAFKKRLKLARLDDESRLGHGATSSGGRSGIMAIQPPAQFPQAVWDELARQGKLRRAGQGLYELPDER